MLIQFDIFSGDELNKPMASVQILLLLYTIYNMNITCMLLKIKYVYTKTDEKRQKKKIYKIGKKSVHFPLTHPMEAPDIIWF